MNTRIFNGLGKKFAIGTVAILIAGIFVSVAYATVANVVVTSPNTGDIWNNTHDVVWIDTSNASPYNIFYSSDFLVYSNLASSEPGSPYSWDTTSLSDGTYKIKVVNALAEEGISDAFIVDNTDPTLTVVLGIDGGPVQTDTINVTTADNLSGVASQEYGFSADNVCNATDTITTTFTSGDDFYITGDHTDYLCTKATDNAGNVGYKLVGQLNTDNTVPTATVVGTTIQGAGDTIEITFNENVVATDGNWTDGSEFDLESPVGTSLNKANATFVFSSNVLTVTLNESAPDTEWLKNGDMVKVIPLSGTEVKDTAGNFLSGSAVTSVAVTGDVVQPTVALTYSPDREVRDADTVTITATFNELVEPGADRPVISIDTTGVDVAPTVMSSTGDPLVWTYSWDVPAGSDGVATVTIDAEDYAGNANTTATNNERTIDNTAPTVGSSYLLNDNTADTFFNSTSDNAKIEITADEPVKYTRIYICDIADGVCDDGTATRWYTSILSYDPSVSKTWDGYKTGGSIYAPDGKYKIKINFEDEAGNTSTETLAPYNIFVDTQVPDITDFDKPVADTVYRTDPPLDFTPGDFGGLGALTCSYALDGGVEVPVATCTAGTATLLTETIPGLTDGRHDIDVTVTDQAGNTVTSSPVISFVYDDDGILTVDDTPANNPDFPTIQEANDAWVSGITTVDVAAGTYAENLTVDQGLKIIGPNAGFDPNTGLRVTEATIAGPSTGNVVTIASNGVTIDGLTITNNGILGTGIYSADFSNLTVQNNIITNIGNGSDDIVGRGIIVVSSSSPVDDITIQNNRIDDITSGLRTGTASKSASGISIGWSTGSDDITDLLIQDNVISDIDANTSPWSTTKGQGAYGILLNHGSAGGQTPGAEIKNNTISDLEGLWAHGIGLEGDTPNTKITGNVISNLTDWKGNTDAFGVFFQDNPSAASVTITGNQFNGLKAEFGGVGIHSDDLSAYGYTVTAENNWWGDPTGPFDGPLAGNKNPNGLGTHVTKNVDYSPFYNSAGMSNLVSVDPIASFDLDFSPNPQTVNQNSTLTVTALDAGGVTVVNDTSTQLTTVGDNGSSFPGGTLLTMEADGDVTTTITNTVAGIVTVFATEVGGSAAGTNTINFTNSDITGPQIINESPLDGTTGVSINAVPYLDFNEPIKAGTIGNIELRKYSDDSVVSTSIAWANGGTRVTITPTSPLSYNTQYYFVAPATVTDPTGNALTTVYDTSIKAAHEFTTEVLVLDTTPPTITLLGQNPITLTVGDSYIEAGATANDDIDGDLTSSITTDSSAVNISVAGTYEVTYNVSDTATIPNAAVEEIRTVIVTDPAATPVIPQVTLTGLSIVSSYTVSEATTRFASGLEFETNDAASATVNGSTATIISSEITAATQAQAITLGVHTYNVIVTSSTGHTANITVSYLVTADEPEDNSNPIITLLGQNPMTLTVGDTFTDPGATANDDVDGNLTLSITFGGTIVDGFVTTTAGTYTVTYDVADNWGNNATQETRTVIVNADFDDTATLAVTGIDAVKTYATADDTYGNGWSWKYYVTVPTGETQFKMKFSDFISGVNTIAATNNIRFYTAQSSANSASTTAVMITAANTYSPTITLDTDLSAGIAGRQIEVIVEMKVPTGSAGGSYSGSYGVMSDPVI